MMRQIPIIISFLIAASISAACANENNREPQLLPGWTVVSAPNQTSADPNAQNGDQQNTSADPNAQNDDQQNTSDDTGAQNDEQQNTSADPGAQNSDQNDPTDHTERPANWAQPVEAAGLPNLHKVSDILYRSAQPESGGFASAEALGIKTVLNIQLLAQDEALAQSEPTSLHLVHIPMTPIYFPEDQVSQALKTIKNGPHPVLVHCRHGADRTGLIVALYRIIFQNWTREAAKDELVNGGFGYHEAFENILTAIDEANIDRLRELVEQTD